MGIVGDLTDAAIRKAKPRDKPYRLADGGGLALFVAPGGAKLWRIRYRWQGREQTISLGAWPQVGLAEAREHLAAVKVDLQAGRNPAAMRRLAAATQADARATTFELVAREWHALNVRTWVDRHAADVLNSLERDVFPTLGDRPIAEIQSAEVLRVVRAIEARPAIETARRVRQRMSAVFAFAVATGRAAGDPAAVVKGALAPLVKRRQPAVLSIEEARAVLAAVDATPAHLVTRLALRLLALTVVRPGTLAATPWAEFDGLDRADPVWRIPASRMKLRLANKDDPSMDHLVPLAPQAMAVIEALRGLTGRGRYVFPNGRSPLKPMSENAMGYLLNRAGYHQRHVPHGWRATFSTCMNERRPEWKAIIDLMLAHTPDNAVEAAYNRARHMAIRRQIAEEWATLLVGDGALPPGLGGR